MIVLTDLTNSFTTGRRIKFTTKLVSYLPTHFKHVATLPCEMQNAKLWQITHSIP